MAGGVDPDFCDQLAVARAHVGDATLQRAGADAELTRRARQRCAALAQRRGDGRPNSISGRRAYSLHGVAPSLEILRQIRQISKVTPTTPCGMAIARQILRPRYAGMPNSSGTSLQDCVA